MDIRKLQRVIVDGLEDVKGQHIVVFNTEHLSSLFERVVIASGTSNRQTKALAASVRDAVKSRGFGPPRVEGEENGEWIIVDCGAAVVHVMQPSIRDYYHLEEIWGGKPVRLKLDGAKPGLVKAATTTAAAKRKPSASPGASTRVPAAGHARVAASKTKAVKAAPAQPARARPAAGKSAARKPAPAKKAITRSVGVKSTPAAAPRSRTAPTKVLRRKA